MHRGDSYAPVFASGCWNPPRAAPVTCLAVPGLLQRRLIFVTGKGGVGKSTVATALGLLAARRGLRTIVAELASQQRVGRAFAHEGDQFRELQVAPHLFTISIDPERAMEEYLRLKVGAVGHVLSSSKLFHSFAMATPGMRELCSVGKVWELAQLERRTSGAAPYDFVVVDAPATGHGVGVLRTPRTFSEIARVGPIARQGSKIADTIADREFTGIVAVATPEEMAVNETFALRDALARDRLHLDLVIVNALYPPRFDGDEITRLSGALARVRSPLGRTALKAALSEHARTATQHEQRARLNDGLDGAVIELPYLFADHVGRVELEVLADALEAQLHRQTGSAARS
jgi:anion-transporting  ArsA/GET3 family ATPase